MDESISRMWSGAALGVREVLGLPAMSGSGRAGPHNAKEFAQKLFAYESLAAAPPRRTGETPEPYSLQWFLDIENQRHSRHGRWIPRLLEFTKHSGERLLGLGHGLGTDWVQYAHHGASVLVCSSSTAQLDLVRRNFALRGLEGQFLHAHPAHIPLASASIDVACISSLYHGIDLPEPTVAEVYRILKPGGKVLAVTPARYDVDFWVRTIFFWNRWLDHTSNKPAPEPEERLSGRELRRLFGRFIETRIHKRQLRRSEVPHIWRWMPMGVMSRLMGRVLVLKAFKPVSAARAA